MSNCQVIHRLVRGAKLQQWLGSTLREHCADVLKVTGGDENHAHAMMAIFQTVLEEHAINVSLGLATDTELCHNEKRHACFSGKPSLEAGATRVGSLAAAETAWLLHPVFLQIFEATARLDPPDRLLLEITLDLRKLGRQRAADVPVELVEVHLHHGVLLRQFVDTPLQGVKLTVNSIPAGAAGVGYAARFRRGGANRCQRALAARGASGRHRVSRNGGGGDGDTYIGAPAAPRVALPPPMRKP